MLQLNVANTLRTCLKKRKKILQPFIVTVQPGDDGLGDTVVEESH